MKIVGIIILIWLLICALTLLVLHIKSHTFFKSVILNAALGFGAVLLINAIQKFTGVFVPVNWFTAAGSGIFGLPCVCGIILAQMII